MEDEEIEIYHILPINDIKEHTEKSTCKCDPTIDDSNGCILIIHNSYDGREAVEWTNEILKNS